MPRRRRPEWRRDQQRRTGRREHRQARRTNRQERRTEQHSARWASQRLRRAAATQSCFGMIDKIKSKISRRRAFFLLGLPVAPAMI